MHLHSYLELQILTGRDQFASADDPDVPFGERDLISLGTSMITAG